jgi:DNA polymerase (family 10)
MQDPAEVAHGLEEIAALLAFAGEPKFRVKAYEHAASLVDALGNELGSAIEQNRLRDLQGIGPALSSQIRALWNEGTSELLLRLRREHPEGAAELVRVAGMTPRRIRALHAALGIRSVEDLRAACLAHRVRDVPGFGAKTEVRLLAASEQWLGHDRPRLPLIRARALELAALLQRECALVAPRVEFAGSLRRGEDTVSAVDLVIQGDCTAALRRIGGLRQVVRTDERERTAQLSAGVPLRIHGAESGWGNAWFLATGSASHVELVEARASQRGFHIARSDTPARGAMDRTFSSEAELYAAVDLPPIPPELRQGAQETQIALNEDFSDLIELRDLQGIVHCHTNYSDGKNTILEMALAAQALGMRYITITDHSPSAYYAHGVALDRLKAQWDEIADVQKRVAIRILRGTECDILADGSLDYPDEVLEQLDVIIASIHARHRLGREQMTERLVRALSSPLFKIWGHGLGRILNHRPPIECDVLAVLDALARSRGAIELNADPHRLDLPAEWIPAAKARRIPFVISADAHSRQGFDVLGYGVTMARRGGVRRQEVLNVLDANEFAALVKPT